jgi:hypothetical protein
VEERRSARSEETQRDSFVELAKLLQHSKKHSRLVDLWWLPQFIIIIMRERAPDSANERDNRGRLGARHKKKKKTGEECRSVRRWLALESASIAH